MSKVSGLACVGCPVRLSTLDVSLPNSPNSSTRLLFLQAFNLNYRYGGPALSELVRGWIPKKLRAPLLFILVMILEGDLYSKLETPLLRTTRARTI